MSRKRALGGLALLALVGLLAACADAQEMKRVSGPNGLFSFSVPADWEVKQEANEITAWDRAETQDVWCGWEEKRFPNVRVFMMRTVGKWSQDQQGWSWEKDSVEERQVSGFQAILVTCNGTEDNVHWREFICFVLTDTHQLALKVSCRQDIESKCRPLIDQILKSLQLGSPGK